MLFWKRFILSFSLPKISSKFVSIIYVMLTAFVAFAISAKEGFSDRIKAGLKHIAILCAVIFVSLSTGTTSFFKKSITNIRVKKLRLVNDLINCFTNSFLLETPWSWMSLSYIWKGIIGSFKLLKNFFIRLATRCGLLICSKYPKFLLLNSYIVSFSSSMETLFLNSPYWSKSWGLFLKYPTRYSRITGTPSCPIS